MVAAFLLLGVICYRPSFFGGIIYDDFGLSEVLNKPLDRVWVRWLTRFSWKLNWWWSGKWWSIHTGNVALHVCGGLVVASFLGGVRGILAGSLFVVHPWAVNVVSYMSGRASVLSGVFGASGVLALALGHPYICAVLFCVSLLAKEDAIGFLVTYALVGGWAWSLALVVGVLLTWWKFDGNTADKEMAEVGVPVAYGPWDNFRVVSIHTILMYPCWALGLAQSPHHGSGFPEPDEVEEVIGLVVWVTALSLYIGIPQIRLGLALVLTGPWLVYLFVRVHEPIAEYRNYSSLFGLVLLASYLPWCVLMPLSGFFGLLTYRKSHFYKTSRAFWTESSEKAEGDRSHAYSELSVSDMGFEGINWARAEGSARKALELNPSMGPARKNLAWCLLKQNRVAEGLKEFEITVEKCPRYALGWQDLGMIYHSMGRIPEARKSYKEALALNPHLEPALVGMKAIESEKDV